MIIVKGKNQKSKWLFENFIDGKTLVFEGSEQFPKCYDGFYIHPNSNQTTLNDFVGEYVFDKQLQNQYNKVVIYNITDVDFAKKIELEIKKYVADFQLAVVLNSGEILNISKI